MLLSEQPHLLSIAERMLRVRECMRYEQLSRIPATDRENLFTNAQEGSVEEETDRNEMNWKDFENWHDIMLRRAPR